MVRFVKTLAHRGVLAACLGALGCLPRQPVTPVVPKPANEVKTAGACAMLGEAKPAVAPDALLRKIDECLTAGRTRSARLIVQRFPDVSLELLRGASDGQVKLEAMQAVARFHDEQCGSKQGCWSDLLHDRTAHPERYTAFNTEIAAANRAAPADRAAILAPLARTSPHPLLEIEAHRLLGESLLSEKPAEAVGELTTALHRAEQLQPYQAVQIMLTLGEAQRRAGQTEQAQMTWQRAVLAAARLLPSTAVFDPALWHRIASLRPANCGWPAELGAVLYPAAKPKLDETWVWTQVGRWHLDRGEAQGALLAFKRAEAMTTNPALATELQLFQARAMVQLDQPVAARTVLAQLAESGSPEIVSQALALLGAMKLREGSGEQALALLRKAVEQGPASEWPGRAQAEADLGLAQLMMANEIGGLRSLHQAEEHFTRLMDNEQLVQCLENEARYLEVKGKKGASNALWQRIHSLEGT